MRLTVIPEDNLIIKDGVARTVTPFPETDPNVHAIQWYGEHGNLEHKIGAAEYFTDETIIEAYVAAWESEAE